MSHNDYDGLVRRVKESINLAEMVENAGVALNSKGMGLCPFHEENTPSFHVEPEKGLFYCHGGCGSGGDAIAFHMKREGLPFLAAIEDLAQRYRIPMPANFTPEQKEAATKESRRRDVLTQLVNFWHGRLKAENGKSLKYCVDRWTTDVVDREMIGFAADDEKYRDFLGTGEITFDEEKAFGLVDEEKPIPHPLNGCLRDRIIIPDWRGGKVVFIWTRSAIGLPGGKKDNRPKYLPYATMDFHPLGGAPLINEKALSGKPREIWVVEGVSKILTMKRLGIENVVGTPGVSSLGKHFDKFKDVERLWLLFDDDPYKPSKNNPAILISPGNDWAWKYARMFGARARVVQLSDLDVGQERFNFKDEGEAQNGDE